MELVCGQLCQIFQMLFQPLNGSPAAYVHVRVLNPPDQVSSPGRRGNSLESLIEPRGSFVLVGSAGQRGVVEWVSFKRASLTPQSKSLQAECRHADEEQRRCGVLQRMTAKVLGRQLPIDRKVGNDGIESGDYQTTPQQRRGRHGAPPVTVA